MYTPINIVLKNDKEYVEVMNTDTFKLAILPLANYKKEVEAGRLEKWTTEAMNKLYRITRLGIEPKENVYVLIDRVQHSHVEYILVDMYRRKLVVNTKQRNQFTRNINRITLLNGKITVENGDIYMDKLSDTEVEKLEKTTKKLTDTEIALLNKKSAMMEFGYSIERVGKDILMYYNNQADKMEKLVVPTGVTRISGFHSLKRLKSVQIAGTCKEVGNFGNADYSVSKNGDVFFFCKHLEKLEFREGVEVIHTGVARFCRELKEVYLPSTLKSIDSESFSSAKECIVYIPKDNGLKNNKLILDGTGLEIRYI